MPGSTQYLIALSIYGGNTDKGVHLSAKHTDTALKLIPINLYLYLIPTTGITYAYNT